MMLARVRVKCGDNKYNNLIVPYIYIYNDDLFYHGYIL